jgi:4-amino-4-deoxy-L-arabinose transferase-like glycosyltransferase
MGLARNSLPGPDGLKYIRVAQDFHVGSWFDVVRNADRHPLYPALIASVEPVCARVLGPGPLAWTRSAQLVSALAALGVVLALYRLAQRSFGSSVALLTALLAAVLPVPTLLGHDTLADPIGWLAIVAGLWLGEDALARGCPRRAAACGLAVGIGYLARPETLVAVAAVALVGLARAAIPTSNREPWRSRLRTAAVTAAALGAALPFVAGYALAKGELSEKLAVRRTLAIPSPHDTPRPVLAGLDNPDPNFARFTPKEESTNAAAQNSMDLLPILSGLVWNWLDALGYAPAALAMLSILRGRARSASAAFAVLFLVLLVRHVLLLGYLSQRHVIPLALACLPWSAASAFAIASAVAARWSWKPEARARRRLIAAGLIAVVGLAVQSVRPEHPTRWGQGAAGAWLAANRARGEAILDTKGWALFLTRMPGYDAWHVPQALTDSRLAYVVVGRDELNAGSPRAQALRQILSASGDPVASFSESPTGSEPEIQVFRYRRPEPDKGPRS